MKSLFILVSCMALTGTAESQTLVPYRDNTRWGYANEDGDIVLKPQFSKTHFFRQDGFGLIERDSLVTLVDKHGVEQLAFIYSSIFNFKNGLAAVCRGGKFNWIQGEVIGGKWGFINEKFEEVIPCQFSRAESFVGDYAIVQQEDNWGNWGLIEKKGNIILPFQYGSYSFDMRPFPGLIWGPRPAILQHDKSGRGERWQLIDLKGKPLGKPFDAMHGKRSFNDDPFIERETKSEIYKSKQGVLKCKLITGNEIEVKTEKVVIRWIAPNRFIAEAAINKPGDQIKTITGLIDGAGNTVIEFGRYDSFSNFNEGIIQVAKNSAYGFIDATGNEIVSPRYNYVGPFVKGYAYVAYNYLSTRKKGDGFINKHGKEFFKDDPELNWVLNYLLLDERNHLLQPPWLTGGISTIVGNHFAYNNSSKIGVINFSQINRFSTWEEYCCKDYGDSKYYTAIDSTTNLLSMIDVKLDEGATLTGWNYSEFTDELLQLHKGEKVGLLDMSGKVILEPIFDEITRVGWDKAQGKLAFLVSVNNKFGFYTSDGKEAFAPSFERYEMVKGLNNENLFQVTNFINDDLGKAGVINMNGEMVVPQIYTRIEQMDGPANTFQLLSIAEDRQGVMMGHSKVIIPAKYGNVYTVSFAGKTFFNVEAERVGTALMDSLGSIIVPFGKSNYEFSVDENSPSLGPAYFSLYEKKKYGFASSDKGIILPLQYDYIETIKLIGKIFFNLKKNKKYGLADGDGQVVIPVDKEFIETLEVNDLAFAIIKKKGLYGLVDVSGKFILPATYQSIEQAEGMGNGYIFTMMDKQGQTFFLTSELNIIKEEDNNR